MNTFLEIITKISDVNEELEEIIWSSIIGLGINRNAVAYDSSAEQGEFTAKLVKIMKTVQKTHRSSIFKDKLTDIFVAQNIEVPKVKNIRIHQMISLNYNKKNPILSGSLLKTFHELNGSLVMKGGGHLHDDVGLVIGIDMSGTTTPFTEKSILLGSY